MPKSYSHRRFQVPGQSGEFPYDNACSREHDRRDLDMLAQDSQELAVDA